jgi:hypothetical protein
MTYPCIYVLYPKLVHPLHFSPFYLSPLLMVSSIGLKILYSLLYRKYITHIHLLYYIFTTSFFYPSIPYKLSSNYSLQSWSPKFTVRQELDHTPCCSPIAWCPASCLSTSNFFCVWCVCVVCVCVIMEWTKDLSCSRQVFYYFSFYILFLRRGLPNFSWFNLKLSILLLLPPEYLKW